MSTDEQVYAAEDAWLQILRMAGTSSRGYQGKQYQPEGIVNFAGIDDVAAYVAKVLAHLGRDADEIYVVERRGAAKAHYDYFRKEMAIPTREKGGAWALNSAVILHEVAHHLATAGARHEQPFRLSFVRLLEDLGQPENARLLQACYEAHGLGVLAASTTE